MGSKFKVLVAFLCLLVLGELVFLGYLFVSKNAGKSKSVVTEDTNDLTFANATSTPTPFPTAGPTSTPTPTVTIAPAMGAVTTSTTSISFNISGYSTDKFVVEYSYEGGELEAKEVTGTSISLTGLYSGETYTIAIKNALTGATYLDDITEDTLSSGYGDPFEAIDGILMVDGDSQMVTMSAKQGCLGAKVWAQFTTKLYEKPDLSGKSVKLEGGTAMTVTEESSGCYCYLRKKNRWSLYVKTEDGQTGWVDADIMFIDITDIYASSLNKYGIQINRTNAYSSIFTAGGSATTVDTTSSADTRYDPLSSKDNIFTTTGYNEIDGITGRALANYGSKDQMPVIWDLAIELIQCQKNALRIGCTLLIYEGYRPAQTSKDVSSSMWNNGYLSKKSNGTNLANGFLSGYYDTSYYIAKQTRHNKGTAVDLTLMSYTSAGDLGEELVMQTKMHTLDFRCNMAYNNDASNMLYDIMTSRTNLECLSSKQEWWHFQLPDNSTLYPQIYNYIYADYEI